MSEFEEAINDWYETGDAEAWEATTGDGLKMEALDDGVAVMTGNYELIDDSLVEWANHAELKPRRARKGEDASAAGRAQLEAAGYTHGAG